LYFCHPELACRGFGEAGKFQDDKERSHASFNDLADFA
jgi:hypothetical protein